MAEASVPFEQGAPMTAPTRFAVLALTCSLLSLAHSTGTARAAFMVTELDLTYTVSSAAGNVTSIDSTGTQVVFGLQGMTTTQDRTNPLFGKTISNAAFDFTNFKFNPPIVDTNVGLMSLASGGKFSLGPFPGQIEGTTSVNFRMSNAAWLSPAVSIIG